MEQITLIATAKFGLEALVRREVENMEAMGVEFETNVVVGERRAVEPAFFLLGGFDRGVHQARIGRGDREADAAHLALGQAGLDAGESYRARERADLELRACVVATAAERKPALMQDYELSAKQVDEIYYAVADGMYTAVRLGGVPCSLVCKAEDKWKS